MTTTTWISDDVAEAMCRWMLLGEQTDSTLWDRYLGLLDPNGDEIDVIRKGVSGSLSGGGVLVYSEPVFTSVPTVVVASVAWFTDIAGGTPTMTVDLSTPVSATSGDTFTPSPLTIDFTVADELTTLPVLNAHPARVLLSYTGLSSTRTYLWVDDSAVESPMGLPDPTTVLEFSTPSAPTNDTLVTSSGWPDCTVDGWRIETGPGGSDVVGTLGVGVPATIGDLVDVEVAAFTASIEGKP